MSRMAAEQNIRNLVMVKNDKLARTVQSALVPAVENFYEEFNIFYLEVVYSTSHESTQTVKLTYKSMTRLSHR